MWIDFGKIVTLFGKVWTYFGGIITLCGKVWHWCTEVDHCLVVYVCQKCEYNVVVWCLLLYLLPL